MLTLREWRRQAQQRLDDVLEFLRTNPGQLRPPARREWLERLRRVDSPRVGPPPAQRIESGMRIDADDDAAVADLLRRVHDKVSDGLRAVLRDGDAWELPVGQTALAAIVTQDHPIRRRFYYHSSMPSESEDIIRNIAGLVAEVAESLRQCARCQTLFLGRKRGIYCGRACQQAEMVERKTQRRQQTRRTPRSPVGGRRQKKGA